MKSEVTCIFVILSLVMTLSVTSSAQVNDYYPLAIDSKWTYRVRATSTAGTVEKIADVRITSKESARGVECYMKEYTMDGKVVQKECYAWQGNELFLYKGTIEGSFADPDPSQLQLDSPSDIGHRWDWSGTLGGTEHCTLSGEIVKRTSVTVPAGTFDVIEVELVLVTQGESVTFSRWFAEGIGMVKQTESVLYGGFMIHFLNELTSYNIAEEGGSSNLQSLVLDAVVITAVIISVVVGVRSAFAAYHTKASPRERNWAQYRSKQLEKDPVSEYLFDLIREDKKKAKS